MKVHIIDHGFSNLGSVINMLDLCGAEVVVVEHAGQLRSAERVILPGIGAFDAPMRTINGSGLREEIHEFIETGRPLLGICVGLQMLTDGSEEGILPGLGYYSGRCVKLRSVSTETIFPHMRWNSVNVGNETRLFKELLENKFYFVHSYALVDQDDGAIVSSCNYGTKFVAAFEKNNVAAVQFHPEKSHVFGMQLFKNFLEEY